MNKAVLDERKPVFSWPVRIYWEDTDAGGIVFYANYLKFMERARTEWLRSLGIAQSSLRADTGGMFVVADTHLSYQRPARLDDQLLVTAQIVEKTQITLTIRQEIRQSIRLSPAQNMREQLLKSEHLVLDQTELSALPLVCQGKIRIAWVHVRSAELGLKPTRIPSNLLEILQ